MPVNLGQISTLFNHARAEPNLLFMARDANRASARGTAQAYDVRDND
jgi:hypothetical protein